MLAVIGQCVCDAYVLVYKAICGTEWCKVCPNKSYLHFDDMYTFIPTLCLNNIYHFLFDGNLNKKKCSITIIVAQLLLSLHALER